MQRKAMVAAGIAGGLALSWGIGALAIATQGSFSGSGSSISGQITFSQSYIPSAPHDGSDGNPAGWSYFKDDDDSNTRSYFSSKDEFLGSRDTPLDIGYQPEPVTVTEDVKVEIKPPEIRLNPAASAAVGKDTYAFVVDPEPQELQISAGTHTVTVTVTPVGYEWDWGDGVVTKSKVPGEPWPEGTVKHRYEEPGNYTVNCRVYWQGSWEVSGSGGEDNGDVEGELFTDSAAAPLEVRYLIPYLVAP